MEQLKKQGLPDDCNRYAELIRQQKCNMEQLKKQGLPDDCNRYAELIRQQKCNAWTKRNKEKKELDCSTCSPCFLDRSSQDLRCVSGRGHCCRARTVKQSSDLSTGRRVLRVLRLCMESTPRDLSRVPTAFDPCDDIQSRRC
eukprot:gnl/TRDRNA2_/TRDRNA2_170438_c1_seq1.p1 gnl/TRDRNA2_/TRDRNA2_170438_c1~~gnl/TRDRNA2_/TRDRNA2_170438_c1_seq1.p1  ORF type:complete len:142 (-),score=20.13 gnl/TRDRNA2_/TRDRNA2_170438_c1_seq1:92-517(-)